MKDLNEALTEIAAIRRQIVRTAEFRGYGPITVAMTGLVAVAAAAVQGQIFPYGCARRRHLSDPLNLDSRGCDKPYRIRNGDPIANDPLEPRTRNGTSHGVEQRHQGVAGLLLAGVLIKAAPEAV